jgi:DNA-binding beta-propeller fold protein YncE
MALEPDATTPGLWIDPQAEKAGPGTFAVVIGASAYDRLAGGDKPMSKLRFPGLRQLEVSALTAYHFFEWLRTAYHFEGCPLVRCWLLLAPTDAEKKLIAAPTLAHALKPDFGGCNRALNDWFTTMKNLSPDRLQDARASRSFFFFSGHGVELHAKRQCLLSCDFPMPREPGLPEQERVDKVIGTANLADAMNGVDVPHHFFFLDACRDDMDNLKAEVPLDGYPILPVPDVRGSRSNSIFRFHATETGNQAFQGEPPERSLFGQALLEGLSAPARLNPDCRPQGCAVPAHKLICYLGLRIPELLALYPGYQQRPSCLVEAVNPATIVTQVTPPAQQPPRERTDPCEEMRLAVGVSWAIDSLGPARPGKILEAQRHLHPANSLMRPAFAYAWTLWDLATNAEVETLFGGQTLAASAVAVSPDGQWIAFGGSDDTIALAETKSGLTRLTLKGQRRQVTAIAFSPDGRRVASANFDNSLSIWDALTGKLTGVLTGVLSGKATPRRRSQAPPFTSAIAFSPDGRFIAPATRDSSISVWSTDEQREIRHLEGHTSVVTAVAFHPKAPMVATGCADTSVRIWHLDGAESGKAIVGEVGGVTALAFSPDGNQVAIADSNEKVTVWSVDDAKLLRVFKSPIGIGTAIGFSPDGRFLGCARGVYTIDTGWPVASLEITQRRLHARWLQAGEGHIATLKRGRKNEALLIHEKFDDLGKAYEELREQRPRWLAEPVFSAIVNETSSNELLAQMEFSSLAADREHPIEALDRRQIAIRGFDRQPGTNTYRVDIELPPTFARYWLSLRGSEHPFACYLKAGTQSRTRYVIEMEVDGRDAKGTFQLRRIQVDLSPANGGLLGEFIAIWQRYYETVPPALSQPVRNRIVSAIEKEPTESELAVTLALFLFLKNDRLRGLGELIDRASRAFPDSADLAAIRVEGLYRHEPQWKEPPPGAVETLLAFNRLGLPQTVDGLGYLAERIDSTLRFHTLTDAQRQRLGQLRLAVRGAIASSRPGGMFCVFTRPLDQVDPLLLQLPRER